MSNKPKPPRPKKISMVEAEAMPTRPKNPLHTRLSGKPSRITPELIKAITQSIKEGNYFETACNLAGISSSVAREWLKKGLLSMKGQIAEDLAYEEFFQRVREAEAFAEAFDVRAITKASMDGIWQASAWRLERKHPDRWGKKLQVDGTLAHTGGDGGPVEVTKLTPAERKKRLEELKKKQAEADALKD